MMMMIMISGIKQISTLLPTGTES